MSIFGSNIKKVSSVEFKQLMLDLGVKLDQRKRVEVEKMFHSDISSEQGITKAEFEKGLEWFKQNRSKHILNEEDLAYLEEVFAKYF